MTHENKEIRCGTCPYWQRDNGELSHVHGGENVYKEATTGECRFGPPVGLYVDSTWSTVTEDKWCAKHPLFRHPDMMRVLNDLGDAVTERNEAQRMVAKLERETKFLKTNVTMDLGDATAELKQERDEARTIVRQFLGCESEQDHAITHAEAAKSEGLWPNEEA